MTRKMEIPENIHKDRESVREYVLDNLPTEVLCGYGFYGLRDVIVENGKVYALYETGDSCD